MRPFEDSRRRRGDVRREGREHRVQRPAGAQQLAERVHQLARMADAHRGHAAVGVEVRKAAAAVGGDGDLARRAGRGRGSGGRPRPRSTRRRSLSGTPSRRSCSRASCSSQASVKSAFRRLTCVGLKTRAGISVSSRQRRTRSSPRGPSPRWKWTMPALPVISPATCASLASRAISSNVGWLERWSRDRDLADADHAVDVDDVALDGAGERRRREVVAAGVAVRRKALGAEGADLCDELRGRPREVVGAEHADGGRDAGGGVVRRAGRAALSSAARPRRRRR